MIGTPFKTYDNEKRAVGNNKQNQMPTKLSLDTKVECWALWFCLSPLPTMRGDLTKTVTNGLSMTNDRKMRND